MARKGSTVRSEMGGAFGRPGMKGQAGRYDSSPAPFDHPHSLGGGGIPVKTYDETVSSKMPTPTQTAGAETRAPRPGTVQRKYGKSNT